MPRTRGELRRDGSLHGGNRELSTTAFQRLLSVAQASCLFARVWLKLLVGVDVCAAVAARAVE